MHIEMKSCGKKDEKDTGKKKRDKKKISVQLQNMQIERVFSWCCAKIVK